MKTKVFLLFIAALALSIFLFSGCEDEESNAVQKQIKITDIPSAYNGRYGYTGLATMSGDDVVATSPSVEIKNGEVITSLFDFYVIGHTKPFTDNGDYFVYFFITDSSVRITYWCGGIYGVNLSNEITVIPFAELIYVPIAGATTPLDLNLDLNIERQGQ